MSLIHLKFNKSLVSDILRIRSNFVGEKRIEICQHSFTEIKLMAEYPDSRFKVEESPLGTIYLLGIPVFINEAIPRDCIHIVCKGCKMRLDLMQKDEQ